MADKNVEMLSDLAVLLAPMHTPLASGGSKGPDPAGVVAVAFDLMAEGFSIVEGSMTVVVEGSLVAVVEESLTFLAEES